MFSTTESELSGLADSLYERSGDDDERMAELLREFPEDTAHALLTSNLTNAVQAYIYAFHEVPGEALYDLLLLHPAYQLKKGIVLESDADSQLIFAYDKNRQKFVIGVSDGEKILAVFSGEGALERARCWAAENCFE